MNFYIETIRIIATIVIVSYLSICIHIALSLWQAFPIKEEPSTPIYITKKIKDGR